MATAVSTPSSTELKTPPTSGESRKGRRNVRTEIAQDLAVAQATIQAIDRVQAVIEFDLDGTVRTANENFLTVMGYRLDEIQGQHHSVFIEKREAESQGYREFWTKLRRGEFVQGEFKRIGKEGREVWIQASYNPVFDAQGQPFKIVKFATDITAQKKMQVEIEGQLAALHRSQAVIEFDLTGRILTANENFLAVMGYELAEIQGRHHRMFVDTQTASSPAYQEFWDKLNRGEFEVAEYPRLGKHGKEVWIQASYNPIFDLNGRPFKVVKYATDITEDVLGRQRLRNKVDDLLAVTSAAAQGDLTAEIAIEGTEPIDELGRGIQRMMADLRQLISEVIHGTAQFTQGAAIIAESSQNFAEGAQSQSASVEEMSAAIEQLSRSIESVRNSSDEADRLGRDTTRLAQEGGLAVQRSAEAMELIKSSASQVSEIIQVISEIAAQTNLLALNAAIEAARAGEHGLGFAVVADEVRKLAERSSEAAKEISSLIKSSTQRVDVGAELSEQTAVALKSIVESVEATSQKITDIASATAEQASSSSELAKGIQQVAEVTEQAAASSEEMASSAEELGQQATVMNDLVSQFRT